jgi:uncharacterized protein involved in outer membrane biogenesis
VIRVSVRSSDPLFQAGAQISKKRTVIILAVSASFAACAAIWFAIDQALSEVGHSVRRTVEDELAQSYGVSADVEGEAGVDLFPRPALVFSDVSIRVSGAETRSLQIDRIEVPVKIGSLWQRSLIIEDIALIRPLIEFGQRGVSATGEPTQSDNSSRHRPDQGTVPRPDFIEVSPNIGRVQIVDGAIRRGEAPPSVSGANGTLIVAPNSTAASFEGKAVLNGDQTAIAINLDDPAGFAKGIETALRASASSQSLTVRFDGKGSLRPGLFLDGAFEVSLAHPQQVLDAFTGRQNNPARIPPISVRTRLVVEPG